MAEISTEAASIFSSSSDGLTHTFQTNDGLILNGAASADFTVTLSLEIASCTGAQQLQSTYTVTINEAAAPACSLNLEEMGDSLSDSFTCYLPPSQDCTIVWDSTVQYTGSSGDCGGIEYAAQS